MNINELKVGDLIKYKTPDKTNKQIGYFLTTSHIKEIHSNYFIVRGDSLTGSVYYVLFDNVVSKLEFVKGCTCGRCKPNRYKEIKIEKETEIILPETNMQWGCGKLPECPPNESRKENKIYKENPAPRSFKFDFNDESIVDIYGDYKALMDILPDWVKKDKTYTIEIKEKE